MSLTKEMIIQIEEGVQNYSDMDLLNYHYSYKSLNSYYPSSYYSYSVQKSLEEINRRGLDIEKYTKSIRNDIR